MNADEKVRYLANVYLVFASDGEVDEREEALFDSLCRRVEADQELRSQARKLAARGELQSDVSTRFSDRIRNLEDMIFAAYCNGSVDACEKRLIVQYAKGLDIEQRQVNLISQECKRRHALLQQAELTERQRLAQTLIPYGIDQRPMPRGDDVNQVLPDRVGSFQRTPARKSYDVIYAEYSDGPDEISMELGICENPAAAQNGVQTCKLESADVTEAVLASSIGTDPSFHLARFNNPRMGEMGRGIGLAWTRGRYYFSASAKSRELLDRFMAVFPF